MDPQAEHFVARLQLAASVVAAVEHQAGKARLRARVEHPLAQPCRIGDARLELAL
jgi:hypothetical protein